MRKQIEKLKAKREILYRRLLKYARSMIRGSPVKLYKRCHNQNCSCQKGDKKHGLAYYISVPGKTATEMYYLTKDQALSKKLISAINAFKQYKEITKEISQLNLILYKMTSARRK